MSMRYTNKKICPYCGKWFVYERRNAKYCSESCKKMWLRLKANGVSIHSIEVEVI